MSKKIYDYDSHVRSFDAVVEACVFDEKKGLYALELDKTAFFAEGGGQKCDRGTLESGTLQQVVDVQSFLDEDKKEHICHYVKEAFEVGSTVHGELDYAYRFENMQQHSGEHILSGILYAKKGYHNVGFHLGDDVTTLDFDGPLSQKEVEQLEKEGNEVIYRNLPISIDYPDAETLKQLDYRSKKELTGDIRIVRVGIDASGDIRDAIDCCACCAPHVMKTGEIGMIKIIRAENYKGGMRLTIVCGSRALRDYSQKHESLSKMAVEMSTSPEKVPASMQKLRQEVAELSAKADRLTKELMEFRVEKLKRLGDTQSSLCLLDEGGDAVAARNLVNALTPYFKGHVAVLMPKAGDEFFFIVGSAQENMKDFSVEMRKELNARGGGSDKMIQGTIRGEVSVLEAFLA